MSFELKGRGENTHAYIHSLEQEHHVFLNVETKKSFPVDDEIARFYCLPDNYEVFDPSLNDITMALDPEYTPEDLKHLPRSLGRRLSSRRDGNERDRKDGLHQRGGGGALSCASDSRLLPDSVQLRLLQSATSHLPFRRAPWCTPSAF